jgi:hypothetical protein
MLISLAHIYKSQDTMSERTVIFEKNAAEEKLSFY